jgi:hypothetical protein
VLPRQPPARWTTVRARQPLGPLGLHGEARRLLAVRQGLGTEDYFGGGSGGVGEGEGGGAGTTGSLRYGITMTIGQCYDATPNGRRNRCSALIR